MRLRFYTNGNNSVVSQSAAECVYYAMWCMDARTYQLLGAVLKRVGSVAAHAHGQQRQAAAGDTQHGREGL